MQIEDGGLGIANHSIVRLIDSLAVQTLYATLAPNLGANPSNRPGYRFVDVVNEFGQRYRYTGSIKDVTITSSIISGGDGKTKYVVKNYTLESRLAPDPPPRYGVTFEDHVIPEERALGIASSTIKVLDLQTNETLGEYVRYAWSAGKPSPANPSPWLTARRCPPVGVGADAVTRKFVDQVLIPAPAR